MNEVPKIVHHRLRAATPAREVLERTHPDADVLNAFAEQALAASEREGVLQHLALCTECREVVALALPEIHTATPPMEGERGVVETGVLAQHKANRFSWASLNWAHLRWATLAAGIAVAVLVVRPGLERMGKRIPLNSAANQVQVAQPESPSQGASSQVASGPQPGNSPTPNLAGKSVAQPPLEGRAERAARNTGSTASQSELQLAGNMPSTIGGLKQNGGMKKDSAATPAAPLEFRFSTAANKSKSDESALSKSAAGNLSTTVEVAAGASEVSTETSEEARSPEPSMMARADGLTVQSAPKIEKAKPALDETTRDAAVGGSVNESQKTSSPAVSNSAAFARSQAETREAEVASKAPSKMKAASVAAAMPNQNVSWMIADGVLQRSLDSGHTWQTAARADHALLCYANRGQDVWAGGQAGRLLHSSDNGATWSAVAVSINGQPLSSDVTHLAISGPSGVVLSTETQETWSSSDGGKTWGKK